MKLRWPSLNLSRFRRRVTTPTSRSGRAGTVVHRARGRAAESMEEFEEEQPTTRLSTACLVVVALHLVLVGGIYAFHSIKANRPPAITSTPAKEKAPAPAKDKAPAPAIEKTAAAPAPASKTTSPAANATAVRPVALNATNEQRKSDFLKTRTEEKKPAAPAKVVPKTYTLGKNETLMFVQRKFGVPYDELVKLNSITDPRKLQVGQVLKLPQPK